eukprot:1411040-Lingulodinium_polyedra.AAC.1
MDTGAGDDDPKDLENQMKLLRSSIAIYQPVSSTFWGPAALNAANEELERLRVRLLDAEPP